MFKIVPDPLFTADVPLTVPGQAETVPVRMTFRYKDKAGLIDFEKRCMDKETAVEDLLGEIIEDWNGVDAPCTPDAIKQICAHYVTAPAEIISAFNKELVRSKIKN